MRINVDIDPLDLAKVIRLVAFAFATAVFVPSKINIDQYLKR